MCSSQPLRSLHLCSAIRAIEMVVESIPKLFNPDFQHLLKEKRGWSSKGGKVGLFTRSQSCSNISVTEATGIVARLMLGWGRLQGETKKQVNWSRDFSPVADFPFWRQRGWKCYAEEKGSVSNLTKLPSGYIVEHHGYKGRGRKKFGLLPNRG